MSILKMEGITKRFPGTVALDHVDLELQKGEIHALMGQNGAGKSTLIKIISGVYTPDEGTIALDGEAVTIRRPSDALGLGISIVSQELSICPHMTVAENIFLGRVPVKGGFVDWKTLYRDAEEVLERIGVGLDPRARAGKLSVAQKQIVEIAKAVSRDCKILLMDEPTSALTPAEIEHLFQLVWELRDKGMTVIYVSHKLDEIFRLCQRMTILRDGRHVGVYDTPQLTPAALTQLMVGKNVDEYFGYGEEESGRNLGGRAVLEARGLCSSKGRLQDVSFQLMEGEVLGIYGLMGSGRTELLEALYGVSKIDGGEVLVEGKPVTPPSPAACMKNGMAFIPEERKEQGLFLELSVAENLTIANMDEICKSGVFVNKSVEQNIVDNYIRKLSVKTPSKNTKIKSLSGGNQQKVIISRWLAKDSRIMLMDEPTRGIDVGAKLEIYNLIKDLAEKGYSVLVVSSELPEILKLCDRVLLMNSGRIVASIPRREIHEEKINQLISQTMAG